jgi:hypothetical protein
METGSRLKFLTFGLLSELVSCRQLFCWAGNPKPGSYQNIQYLDEPNDSSRIPECSSGAVTRINVRLARSQAQD